MSFPLEWYPTFDNISPNTLILDPSLLNAVQSLNPPYAAAALPMIHSTKCPIVIRDGMAWGFIIKSGRTPSRVKGISFSGMTSPIVPFCPAREAILSPILGILISRTRTFAMRVPSSPSVMNVLSTIPTCPFFGVLDASCFALPGRELLTASPIKTVLSVISVFSFTNPYWSNSL